MFPSWYQSRLFLRKSDSLEPNDQWGMSTEDKRFCATESAFLSRQCLKSWWNLVEYQTVSFNWHRKKFCYYWSVSECTYQFCSVYMFTFSHTIYTLCVFRAKYSDLKNLFFYFSLDLSILGFSEFRKWCLDNVLSICMSYSVRNTEPIWKKFTHIKQLFGVTINARYINQPIFWSETLQNQIIF